MCPYECKMAKIEIKGIVGDDIPVIIKSNLYPSFSIDVVIRVLCYISNGYISETRGQ